MDCLLAEQTPFERHLSIAEVDDFVLCLRFAVDDLEESIQEAIEHCRNCGDRRCVRQGKKAIKMMRQRRRTFQYRLNNIAPYVAKQKEILELEMESDNA
jgi:hypothetical protein